MTLASRLDIEYQEMRADSALVTAADAKYAPFLFNALSSIHANFPDHPVVYIFDLGLSRAQRCELNSVPWIRVKTIDKFVSHWKAGWSWKPHILTQVNERFVLYFDAANIVLYRSISLWFLAVKRHGFFGVANGQLLREITPSEYWSLFNLDSDELGAKPTFGAGLFGFDQLGPAGAAIRKCLSLTIDGWSLGRSPTEKNQLYGKVPLRDCVCFRADQTLFNLAMVEYLGTGFLIRDEMRYCGRGGPRDHTNQYLWYSRRDKKSMVYFGRPLNTYSCIFVFNRTAAWLKLVVRWRAAELVKWISSMRVLHKAN